MLELGVGVADVGGEPLLRLHQRENLLLDARLLLLDLLDLDQHRGVLLVGLDLVEPGLGLGALGGPHVQVLLPRPDALLGGIEAGLGGVEGAPRRAHARLDGLDLLREAGRLALEPGDARVERLQVDQQLELSIHVASVRMVGPPGLEPGPDRL